MIVKYGTYAFPDSAVSLSIAQSVVRVETTGLRRGITKRWTLSGELQAASVAALTTALQAMETAFAEDGKDLVLYASDGSTATAHRVLTADAQGGVRVVDVNYPTGDGSEYVNFRSFEITLEAFLPVSDADIVSYEETIQKIGTGGPIWKLRTARTGPPQRQQLNQFSTMTIVQSGRAVGQSSRPGANAPLFPSLEHEEQRQINLSGPRADQGELVEYGIQWTYVMESATAVTADPTPFT